MPRCSSHSECTCHACQAVQPAMTSALWFCLHCRLQLRERCATPLEPLTQQVRDEAALPSILHKNRCSMHARYRAAAAQSTPQRLRFRRLRSNALCPSTHNVRYTAVQRSQQRDMQRATCSLVQYGTRLLTARRCARVHGTEEMRRERAMRYATCNVAVAVWTSACEASTTMWSSADGHSAQPQLSTNLRRNTTNP